MAPIHHERKGILSSKEKRALIEFLCLDLQGYSLDEIREHFDVIGERRKAAKFAAKELLKSRSGACSDTV